MAGHPITDPETIATAIRIGNPASWEQAVEARDTSKGVIESVTDEQSARADEAQECAAGVPVRAERSHPECAGREGRPIVGRAPEPADRITGFTHQRQGAVAGNQ